MDAVLPDWFSESAVRAAVASVVGLVAVGVIVKVLTWLYRALLRRCVGKELGVRIHRGFRVSRAKTHRDIGAFLLAYPTWRYAKKDGTRDRRRSDNAVINHWSVLEVGRWRINCQDVFALYDLVLAVRGAGVVVAESAHEQRKREATSSSRRARHNAVSIDSLISAFASRPTDFERFCADLFRSFGFRVETTPPVRDGGVDLRMSREGWTYIVECKCYDRSHRVGRPVIQKLQGANAVEMADRMVVVTTSAFSQDAIDYAGQVGAELIDGDHLIAMCSRAWGNALPPSIMPDRTVALSADDLLTGFPADLRHSYS